MEHVHDVWKVIVSGRAKFGKNWYGSGGYYSGADAFAKHFAPSAATVGTTTR